MASRTVHHTRLFSQSEETDMRRMALACCLGMLLQVGGGCFPNYFFQDLLGSAVGEFTSLILTQEFYRQVLPPG
jgi:hypothetical protein